MDFDLSTSNEQQFERKRTVEYSGANSFFDSPIVSRSSKGTKDAFTGADWLSVREAALYLRILRRDGRPCEQRVRNLVHQGRLPFYKPFGRLLFKRSELQALIEVSRKGVNQCR